MAEVVAMDLSDAMLEQVAMLAAERQIDNITLKRGDVENIPFADNEFDLVVSRYSAHHWPDPQRALREIPETLTAAGRTYRDLREVEPSLEDVFVALVRREGGAVIG